MDRDGIHAHVVYGPPLSLPIPDLEVRAACSRAYNNWAADFNRADPNRLVVLALLPSHTPEAATAELVRVAALGHRGAIVDFLAGDDPAFEDSWERFWATANELAMPDQLPSRQGHAQHQVKPGSWRMAAGVAVSPMQLDEVLTGMIFSGMLERYPNVRVVLRRSRARLGALSAGRLDHEYEKYHDLISDACCPMSPREYFRRQVFLTYEEDNLGIELLPHIGATNVLWASDYPHGDSTWPHSLEAIAASGWAGSTTRARRSSSGRTPQGSTASPAIRMIPEVLDAVGVQPRMP